MYRILIVDEEPDVLAVARLFVERDRDIVADTTSSPACALAKMEVSRYDAVVSDYRMQGMNGIAFLREVRSRYGDIPFIIMTAHSREEVVIEALNSGATGYLQKGVDITGTFAELIHLIKNSAGKRDAERALLESEGRYNDLVENAYDLIQSVSPDGRFLLVNRAWCEALGYTAEEASVMTVFDVIAPEAMDAYMEMFSALLRGALQERFETVLQAKNGRRICVLGNINCRMAGGIPVASRAIFRIISGMPEDEGATRTMLGAIRSLPLPLLFTDGDGIIIWANSHVHRLFGENCPSLGGVDVRRLFSDSACWDRIIPSLHEKGEWQGEALMQSAGVRDGCCLSLSLAAATGSGGVPEIIGVVFHR